MTTTSDANADHNFLTLYHNQSYQPKVEAVKDWENSWLKSVYRQALQVVADIVQRNDSSVFDDYWEVNNVIGFMGDRGTGKSSALLSVAKALVEQDSKGGKLPFESEALAGQKFYKLGHIDPTVFSGQESLLEVFVAKLYKKFKKASDQAKKDCLEDREKLENEKEKVYQAFQKAFKSLKAHKSGTGDYYKSDWEYSSSLLQDLELLAVGPELKNSMEELVEVVLTFFIYVDTKSVEEGTASFLLVTIDDLDLNMESPMKIMEIIRKYLLIPRVVVFIGARLEQLIGNVDQYYMKEYDGLIKAGRLFENTRDMARKYLDKLLPSDHRIAMPDLETSKRLGKKLKYVIEGEATLEYKSIEEGVVSLTRRKIGVQFEPRLYKQHPALPKNLRDLHNYIAFLANMPEPDTWILLMQNVKQFKEMMFSSWAKENMSRRLVKFFQRFESQPLEQKNKFLCSNILEKIHDDFYPKKGDSFQDRKDQLKSFTAGLTVLDTTYLERSPFMEVFKSDKTGTLTVVDFSLKLIIDKENHIEGLSIGDVMFLLQVLQQHFEGKQKVLNLIFLIRLSYSINFITLWKEFIPAGLGGKLAVWDNLRSLIGESIYPQEAISILQGAYDNRVEEQDLNKERRSPSRPRSGFLTKNMKMVVKNVGIEDLILFSRFVRPGQYFEEHRKSENKTPFFEDPNKDKDKNKKLQIKSQLPDIVDYGFFDLLSFPARSLDYFDPFLFESSNMNEPGKSYISSFFHIPFHSLESLEMLVYHLKRDLGDRKFKSSDSRISIFKEAIIGLTKDGTFSPVTWPKPFERGKGYPTLADFPPIKDLEKIAGLVQIAYDAKLPEQKEKVIDKPEDLKKAYQELRSFVDDRLSKRVIQNGHLNKHFNWKLNEIKRYGGLLFYEKWQGEWGKKFPGLTGMYKWEKKEFLKSLREDVKKELAKLAES